MGHKCFISFKTEDFAYKTFIQTKLDIDMIDKSLNYQIDSDNEDYIMRRIRENHLADSTVTIHLIGAYSAESLGEYEQRFIKRELQASLYHAVGNTRNGILGVVLPEAEASIYRGLYMCPNCGRNHDYVAIGDSTVVREFSYNYYIPNGKCFHSEDDRYCVLTSWKNFCADPNKYIEAAFLKRTAPIADKVKVRP